MSVDQVRQSYVPRYVAFVDILGWKEIVENIGGEFDRLEDIAGVFLSIAARQNQEEWIKSIAAQPDTGPIAKVEMTIMSDATVLSTLRSKQGLVAIIDRCTRLCADLLNRGFLPRGALVVGSLFHEESVVFGKGLTAAYRLETTVAKYPRIIVDRNVVDDLSDFAPWFTNNIRKDNDGLHFLNLFLPEFPSSLDIGMVDYMENVAGCIVRGLAEHLPDTDRFAKYHWLAAQFNSEREWLIEIGELAGDKVEAIDIDALIKRGV